MWTPGSSSEAYKIGSTQNRRCLPQDVAESPNLARATAQAPRLKGTGGGFSSQLRKHRGGSLQSAEAVPQVGAWAGFCSNGLLGERLGSAITAHDRGNRVPASAIREGLLMPLARIPKRLRFYEDAAKVVQRRMVPNFKKSFERAVRSAWRL